MKLKMTEHNGAMALVVSGERQDIIITEESGWFAFELLNKDYSAESPIFVQEECEADTTLPGSALESVAAIPAVVLEESFAAMSVAALESTGEESIATMPVATLESAAESAREYHLFLKLAELRKELAASEGVPPYLVFHNKTLQEMAKKSPHDMTAISRISGVGQAKLDKYGPLFLDVINGVAV